MAEVERLGNKIIVTCDCGAVHKVTIDDDKNLKVKSTFKKKEPNKEPDKKVEKDSFDNFFEDDEEEEEK